MSAEDAPPDDDYTKWSSPPPRMNPTKDVADFTYTQTRADLRPAAEVASTTYVPQFAKMIGRSIALASAGMQSDATRASVSELTMQLIQAIAYQGIDPRAASLLLAAALSATAGAIEQLRTELYAASVDQQNQITEQQNQITELRAEIDALRTKTRKEPSK
jgi:hypothetical protein